MEWKCNVTAVSLLKLCRAPVTSIVWCQMVVLSLSFSHYGVGIISNMFYSMGSWKQSSSAWWTPSVLSASVMSTCCNLFILTCFFCCCCFLPEQSIKCINRSVCFSSPPNSSMMWISLTKMQIFFTLWDVWSSCVSAHLIERTPDIDGAVLDDLVHHLGDGLGEVRVGKLGGRNKVDMSSGAAWR